MRASEYCVLYGLHIQEIASTGYWKTLKSPYIHAYVRAPTQSNPFYASTHVDKVNTVEDAFFLMQKV